MITYLATLMTIAGVSGFILFAHEDADIKAAGGTALKIASALLAAIVTLSIKG